MKLKNKVAIITGASSGIGRCAANRFAEEGANVILGARRESELARLAQEIEAGGSAAFVVAGDVCNEQYARQLVDAANNEFGGVDIGFNNAGIIGDIADVPEMESSNWAHVLNTNLTSAFFAAKHQIPHLKARGGGSLIFTSSFVGHTIGFPGMGAYAASKSGLLGLVQCLAVEHGPDGIRANALLPGGTKTPMAGDFSDDPEAEATIAGFHALSRMADPMEIANAAVFLASQDSSFVTGTAMLVDGGNSIKKA
ncbi:MAG: SDR family oxidoreductase [Pseudomonadota bacterium]